MKFNQFPSLRRASKIISGLANPLLVPVYVIIVFFFSGGIMSAVLPKIKWIYIGQVFFNTAVVPLTSLFFMMRLRLVSDIELSDRRQRLLPLLVVMLCYVITLIILPNSIIAIFVRKFLYAGLAVIAVVTVVNLWWKISMHMAGIGGGLALLVYMYVSGFGSMGAICVCIVVAGLVGSARLCLGAHNPAQVGAGFAVGFAVAYSAMEFASVFAAI